MFSVFSFSKNKLYPNGPKWNELFFKQNTKHENTYKTKQNIVISVGSVTNSVWSCNSNGSIAPASERDSPSNRRPRLDRLVTEAVWFDWHRSVGLTLVSLCSPLPHFVSINFSINYYFSFFTLQKRLLLTMARVCRNNTKSRRRLVLLTVKGRRQPSEKALSVILYYRRDRC